RAITYAHRQTRQSLHGPWIPDLRSPGFNPGSLVRDTQSSCPGRVQRALLRERNETRDPARESRSAILVGPNMLWKKGDAVADGAKVKLQTMLGNYPNTKALKSGEIRSDLVDFDFVEVKVANNLFKKVVREAAYDAAELAI